MNLSFPLIPTEGGRERGYKSVCDTDRNSPAGVSSPSKLCGKVSPFGEGSGIIISDFSQSLLPRSPSETTQACPLHDDSLLGICTE